MRWLLGLAVAGVVILAVSWLWSSAASRGWVYGRGEAPRRGNVVGGLGFEQVFEPEYEHVYEEHRSVEVDGGHEKTGDHDARP